MAVVKRIRGGGAARALEGVGQALQGIGDIGSKLQEVQARKAQAEIQQNQHKMMSQAMSQTQLFDLLGKSIRNPKLGKALRPKVKNLIRKAGFGIEDTDTFLGLVGELGEDGANVMSDISAIQKRSLGLLSKSKNRPTDDQLLQFFNDGKSTFERAISTFSGIDDGMVKFLNKEKAEFEAQFGTKLKKAEGVVSPTGAPLSQAEAATQKQFGAKAIGATKEGSLIVGPDIKKSSAADQNRLDKLKNQKFSNIQSLRKEFNALSSVKQFGEQTNAMARIIGSAKKADFAGDLALIFNFMKMLDPGSVVREGEFRVSENAPPLAKRLANIGNRLLAGERFSPEVRQIFVDRARSIFEESKVSFDTAARQFGDIAKKNSFPPDQVVLDPSKEVFKRADELAKKSAEDVLRKSGVKIPKNQDQGKGFISKDDIEGTEESGLLEKSGILNFLRGK